MQVEIVRVTVGEIDSLPPTKLVREFYLSSSLLKECITISLFTNILLYLVCKVVGVKPDKVSFTFSEGLPGWSNTRWPSEEFGAFYSELTARSMKTPCTVVSVGVSLVRVSGGQKVDSVSLLKMIFSWTPGNMIILQTGYIK